MVAATVTCAGLALFMFLPTSTAPRSPDYSEFAPTGTEQPQPSSTARYSEFSSDVGVEASAEVVDVQTGNPSSDSKRLEAVASSFVNRQLPRVESARQPVSMGGDSDGHSTQTDASSTQIVFADTPPLTSRIITESGPVPASSETEAPLQDPFGELPPFASSTDGVNDVAVAELTPVDEQLVARSSAETGPLSTLPVSTGDEIDSSTELAAKHGVYVPVTVNIDGSAFSAELVRFTDRLEVLLDKQERNDQRNRRRRRPQNKERTSAAPVPANQIDSDSLKELKSEALQTREMLTTIDSTVGDLAESIESLRSETQDAVNTLNNRVEYEQSSLDLLEEYRTAPEHERNAGRAYIPVSPDVQKPHVNPTAQGAERDVTSLLELEGLAVPQPEQDLLLPSTADENQSANGNQATSDAASPTETSLASLGTDAEEDLKPIPDLQLEDSADEVVPKGCTDEKSAPQPMQAVPDTPEAVTLMGPFDPTPMATGPTTPVPAVPLQLAPVSLPKLVEVESVVESLPIDEPAEDPQEPERLIVDPVMFRHTYRFSADVSEPEPAQQPNRVVHRNSQTPGTARNSVQHRNTTHSNRMPANVRPRDDSKLNPLQRGFRAVRDSRWVPDLDFDTPHWIEKIPDSRPVKAVRNSQWLHRLSSTIRKAPSDRTVD